MTRAEVNRTLMHMEQIRHDAMDAETPSQERRLNREYDRMAKAIKPFVTGAEPCSDEITQGELL